MIFFLLLGFGSVHTDMVFLGSQAGQFVWDRWPDFPLALDAPVFYFRNQKQGAGPCAAPDCVWGPLLGNRTKEGGCLAGSCETI